MHTQPHKPITLAQLMHEADRAAAEGRPWSGRVWPTGFTPLDGWLAGGLHPGELTLLAGAPGVGKTTFLLQVARNIARSGRRATYVCYEHDAQQLLSRLLRLEVGLAGGNDAGLAAVTAGSTADRRSLLQRAENLEGAAEAMRSMASYAEHLTLFPASGRHTDVSVLREMLTQSDETALLVDYLQKVPLRHSDDVDEVPRVATVVETLKDVALETDCPVVCIAAADQSGVEGRTKLANLRGSTALAYEADVVLLLNNKYQIVAREHLMYTGDPDRYRDWVICTIEKNRGGLSGVDMQFATRFGDGRFDPEGEMVNERLLGDRIHAQ